MGFRALGLKEQAAAFAAMHRACALACVPHPCSMATTHNSFPGPSSRTGSFSLPCAASQLPGTKRGR